MNLSSKMDLDWVELPSSYPQTALLGCISIGSLLFIVYSLIFGSQTNSKFPLINDREGFEISWSKAKQRFVANAPQLLKAGFSKSRNAFRMITDNGPKLVLSPKYINDIRNDDRLSFGHETAGEFFADKPGFEPFRVGLNSERIFQDAVRIKLTQSLGLVTEPLSEETTFALQKHWGDDPDWHEVVLKQSILDIVARLSSRVFLGPEICRNPAWLRITVDYTVSSFAAATTLRLWPNLLRPVVHWFLPSCRRIRAQLREAREIITPVIEKRRALTRRSKDKGDTRQETDAIAWMEDIAKGRPYDPAVAQLSFSLAAIHTTSDMLTQVIFDLCGKEDLVRSLRDEVISVLSTDGWKKSSLYKLKLMDSVLKESQRLKPLGTVSMRRRALESVQLPDGTTIPKGASILVSSHNQWDPSIYPNPEEFDGYRFLRLRQLPGQENSSQLVSTGVNHLGFGHGKHACPGRFFAANEVKIALCHMLLKYDWKLAETPPKVMKNGFRLAADPRAKIVVRRREAEIPL